MEYHRDVLVYLETIQLHFAICLLDKSLQLVSLGLLLLVCLDKRDQLLILVQIKDFSV